MEKQNEFKTAESLLNSIGDNPSFDIGEFIDRISVTEDWGKLIVAHIYLDHIVTEVLNEHLPHPESYFKNNHRHFGEKLTLCQSLGYFRDEFGNVLRSLNTSRNKFAHKLIFDVSDEEKKNLFRTLTKERPLSEVTKPEGFEDFLFTVVMFAEFERASHKHRSEILRESNQLKDKLYEILRNNLETAKKDRIYSSMDSKEA